jgi:TPR repeat protein
MSNTHFKERDELINLKCNKVDGIAVTDYEIRRARESALEIFYRIGDIYYKKQDYKNAKAWLYKAAIHDYVEAQARLGLMYQLGQGVSVDYKQSFFWFKKAASSGNAEAQFNIGYLYYHGLGVSRDYKQFFFFV